MSKCRFCQSDLNISVVDLGMSPLCQKHIGPGELSSMEKFYPLHALICTNCWLMQLDEFESPEIIFSDDYAYFSSFSDSWLKHSSAYVELVVDRFGLDSRHLVVELASNDGYLLQWFRKKGIPVLGVEPAANVAAAAVEKGVRTEVKFFGQQCAKELERTYGKAALLIGNNVLAHVPNLNDFVIGMKQLLAESGIITMEFPHLLRLIEGNQFDTIYHEHFSYFSFSTVQRIFDYHGLTIFDVEELSTHGGSIRIYACHKEGQNISISQNVRNLYKDELEIGIESRSYYTQFESKVKETKRNLLEFLINAKRKGKVIVGYGAPGKGNTLLNYCGIRGDFIDFTVDRNPHKQNNYLPGTHIPIYSPEKIREVQPDYVMILVWNLVEEIVEQMDYIREWGGQFVVPIPTVKVL